MCVRVGFLQYLVTIKSVRISDRILILTSIIVKSPIKIEFLIKNTLILMSVIRVNIKAIYILFKNSLYYHYLILKKCWIT